MDVVKFLVSKGADIHAEDNCGYTQLHHVANVAVAKFLVSIGVNVNAKSKAENEYGRTPLAWAMLRENRTVEEYLSKVDVSAARSCTIKAVIALISRNDDKWRARQRHLVSADSQLETVEPPEFLYRNGNSIRRADQTRRLKTATSSIRSLVAGSRNGHACRFAARKPRHPHYFRTKDERGRTCLLSLPK